MKKFIKYLFITMICLVPIKCLVSKILDKRPIKFESYEKIELNDMLNKKIPQGSNLDISVKILEDSLMRCMTKPNRIDNFMIFKQHIHSLKDEYLYKDTAYITLCECTKELESKLTVVRYKLFIQSDKERHIIHHTIYPYLTSKSLEGFYW